MEKVLIFMGCPEPPIQVPLAIYTTHKLKENGFNVTIAANPATLRLLEVADPTRKYIDKKLDLESTLESLQERDYNLLVGFIHNDAAVAYFVTFESMLKTESIAIIFGDDAETIQELEKEVKENTDSHIISARAHHNPIPLKIRIDKLLNEQGD